MSTERFERRIARILTRLATRIGQSLERGILLDAPISRQDVAEMTGTALYTVCRTLKTWERTGLVKARRKQVILLDPYKFLVGMGSLATLISSALDHGRTDFSNPWLWIPTAAGVFASITAVTLASMDRPGPNEILVFIGSMLLMIIVGVIGVGLHVGENLISNGEIVGERFLRGAPFMAPLLFANMGTLGLMALLDPREE